MCTESVGLLGTQQGGRRRSLTRNGPGWHLGPGLQPSDREEWTSAIYAPQFVTCCNGRLSRVVHLHSMKNDLKRDSFNSTWLHLCWPFFHADRIPFNTLKLCTFQDSIFLLAPGTLSLIWAHMFILSYQVFSSEIICLLSSEKNAPLCERVDCIKNLSLFLKIWTLDPHLQVQPSTTCSHTPRSSASLSSSLSLHFYLPLSLNAIWIF